MSMSPVTIEVTKMGPTLGNCETVDRMQSNENLVDALRRVESVAVRAEQLLERINGTGSPCAPEGPDKTLPCLMAALREVPDALRDRCDKITQTLGDIENSLF